MSQFLCELHVRSLQWFRTVPFFGSVLFCGQQLSLFTWSSPSPLSFSQFSLLLLPPLPLYCNEWTTQSEVSESSAVMDSTVRV
jgi:hypothetical protein